MWSRWFCILPLAAERRAGFLGNSQAVSTLCGTKRGQDITQFLEEQVLQLEPAGLGCVSRAARGRQELYSIIFIRGLRLCRMLR